MAERKITGKLWRLEPACARCAVSCGAPLWRANFRSTVCDVAAHRRLASVDRFGHAPGIGTELHRNRARIRLFGGELTRDDCARDAFAAAWRAVGGLSQERCLARPLAGKSTMVAVEERKYLAMFALPSRQWFRSKSRACVGAKPNCLTRCLRARRTVISASCATRRSLRRASSSVTSTPCISACDRLCARTTAATPSSHRKAASTDTFARFTKAKRCAPRAANALARRIEAITSTRTTV